jgi:hypothetical protein
MKKPTLWKGGETVGWKRFRSDCDYDTASKEKKKIGKK